MGYLRLLYVDSDRERGAIVKRLLEQTGHDVVVCSQLALAILNFATNGPFDYVICASSVDEERSGDGLFFAKELEGSGQKVVTLTSTAVGLPGIPTVALTLTPEQVAHELIRLLR